MPNCVSTKNIVYYSSPMTENKSMQGLNILGGLAIAQSSCY